MTCTLAHRDRSVTSQLFMLIPAVSADLINLIEPLHLGLCPSVVTAVAPLSTTCHRRFPSVFFTGIILVLCMDGGIQLLPTNRRPELGETTDTQTVASLFPKKLTNQSPCTLLRGAQAGFFLQKFHLICIYKFASSHPILMPNFYFRSFDARGISHRRKLPGILQFGWNGIHILAVSPSHIPRPALLLHIPKSSFLF